MPPVAQSFDFLFDMSTAPPQSAPVLAVLVEISEAFRKRYDLRVALVMSSAPVKMQASRIRRMADLGQGTETGYFDKEEEVRAGPDALGPGPPLRSTVDLGPVNVG